MSDRKWWAKDWDRRELVVPIDVMVHEYRLAKNPNKQINILAEQNSTKPCRIAWLLSRCGCDVDVKKMPRALRNEDSFDYVAFWEQSPDAAVCERIRMMLEDNLTSVWEKLPETATENRERMVEDMHMEADEREEMRKMEKENSPVVEKNIPSAEGDSHCVENSILDNTVPFPTSGKIMVEFWNVYLENRKSGGKLTEKDIGFMRELEEIAIRMVWDE